MTCRVVVPFDEYEPFFALFRRTIEFAIGGGDVFKQEDIEETAQQRIAMHKIFHRATLGGDFFLNRADE